MTSYTYTESVAWEVPNSQVLITLQEIKSYNNKISGYFVGIMFKNDKYTVCTLTGDDKYKTIENLMGKTEQIAESWWKIFNNLKSDGEVVEITDWWNLPHQSENFDKKAFMSLFKHYYQDIDNIKTIFLRSKEKNRYCASLKLNDEIIFKALPSNDKEIAFKNLKMSILGVGATLEKIQSGAWNALIDTDNPNFLIKRDKFDEKIIEKIGE